MTVPYSFVYFCRSLYESTVFWILSWSFSSVRSSLLSLNALRFIFKIVYSVVRPKNDAELQPFISICYCFFFASWFSWLNSLRRCLRSKINWSNWALFKAEALPIPSSIFSSSSATALGCNRFITGFGGSTCSRLSFTWVTWRENSRS